MPEASTAPVFLSYRDLSRRWGLCPATIWDLARRDPEFPPHVRFSRKERRVKLEDVQRYESLMSQK